MVVEVDEEDLEAVEEGEVAAAEDEAEDSKRDGNRRICVILEAAPSEMNKVSSIEARGMV